LRAHRSAVALLQPTAIMSDLPEQPPYGPHTRAVRRFLEHLSRLPPADWAGAARVYATTWRDPAATAADAALALAFERTGRERARDALVGPLVQLARAAAGRAGTDEDALAEVALATALALVVREDMSEGDFARLYAPFAELIPLAAITAER
jgi:hypothetical protein